MHSETIALSYLAFARVLLFYHRIGGKYFASPPEVFNSNDGEDRWIAEALPPINSLRVDPRVVVPALSRLYHESIVSESTERRSWDLCVFK